MKSSGAAQERVSAPYRLRLGTVHYAIVKSVSRLILSGSSLVSEAILSKHSIVRFVSACRTYLLSLLHSLDFSGHLPSLCVTMAAGEMAAGGHKEMTLPVSPCILLLGSLSVNDLTTIRAARAWLGL